MCKGTLFEPLARQMRILIKAPARAPFADTETIGNIFENHQREMMDYLILLKKMRIAPKDMTLSQFSVLTIKEFKFLAMQSSARHIATFGKSLGRLVSIQQVEYALARL